MKPQFKALKAAKNLGESMKRIENKDKEAMKAFLREAVARRGFSRVVLGLSGGIDSAVVTALCKAAFEGDLSGDTGMESKEPACKAILMPALTSSKASIDDSLELCNKLGIAYEVRPIGELESIFCKTYPDHSRLERGNFCARLRMATLYHISQSQKRLVVGTTNKTELLLGYGTIFGDLASAINPIASLYKTQIYELASLLDLPRSIMQKAPSADLYEGQTDEDELGYKYAEIDSFLQSYEKCKGSQARENLKKHYPEHMVDSLLARMESNAFKRELPEFFYLDS